MTTATGAGGWWAVLMVVLGLALPAVLGVGPAVAGPGGSADLEWAQQTLKVRGFDPGRPTGEMNPKTRAALSAYQHSVGLPVTGELDGATTGRLLAGRPSSPTVGNLAVTPQHAQGTGGHEGPAPTPHAVSSGRVEAGGGSGDSAVFGAGAVGAAAGEGGVPRAAPSGTVTAVPSLSSPSLSGEAPSAEPQPFVLMAPTWVRDAVVGVIVCIVGGFAALWWWSGRRPVRRREPLSAGVGGPVRIEPRFGSTDRGRGGGRELRAERFR